MDVCSERCVSKEEGRQLAFDLGIAFYETSTRLSNCHVIKIFTDIVQQIRCVRLRQEEEQVQEAFCGARGMMGRLSMNMKIRRKRIRRKSLQ